MELVVCQLLSLRIIKNMPSYILNCLFIVTLLHTCNSATISPPTTPPTKASCPHEREAFTTQHGCVDIFTNSLCPYGERLYEDEVTGEASCDCMEDFTRVHGTCYQPGTRGPCEEEQYLVIDSGVPICQDNPCPSGSSDVELPREDTSEDCELLYDCEDFVCYKLTGDTRDCFIEVTDEETKEIGCVISKEVSIFAVPKKPCRAGRVWNGYRRRCVRKFRG